MMFRLCSSVFLLGAWSIKVRLGGLLLVVVVMSLSVACSRGSYPLDIFQEMHYHQSYKAQEPPRLDVPSEAVPMSTPKTMATGEGLFSVNCTMCHGVGGRGDGAVLVTLIDKYGYEPKVDADLAGDAVQNLPDIAIFTFISKGITVMPAFEKLLTETERQLIVEHIRTLPSR